MKGVSLASSRRLLARLTLGALVASVAAIGIAKADSDGIINTGSVPVAGNLFTCSSVAAPQPWTPSAFSFDISWVDPFTRAYFLADRSHGVNNSGDVLVLDLNNLTPSGLAFLLPPANDPMAGIACDQNANFGGTTGVGRNELTGPNGAFTVNHTEVWVGDAPSKFQPNQSNAGVGGVASDYAADKCDSSVRVFNLVTGKQTDHINVGGCFRTDEGAFDPVDQVAIFANPSEQVVGSGNQALNHSPFVTLLSTRPVGPNQHHKILKQINFDGTHGTYSANGGIEQPVYSRRTGLFYIAVPGNSADSNNGVVAVIDPRGDADDIHFVKNFHVRNCSPNGAALGPDYELFLGCSGAFPEQVIDIRNGHLIRTAAGTNGGCDEVYFNGGDDHFVGACTGTTATGTDALDVVDADPVQHDISIDTKTKGAHSVASDPVTVQNFMPAAAGTGPNTGGLCGATPCILLFGSTGGDDKSVWQQEAMEDHHHDNR
jgi:hypothetical protein